MSHIDTNSDQSLIPLDPTFAAPKPTAPREPAAVQRLPGNPYTTMVQLINNQWGPCPISAQFPMHGGTLTIHFSASVHTDTAIPNGSLAQVGYEIFVDNVSVGKVLTFVSAANLWGSVSTVLVVENLSIDNHTITIQPSGPYTSNDQFDLFNLTVIEL